MSLVSANKVETNTYELVVSIGAEDFKKGIDKIYKKIFTRRESIINEPSVNAVPIPEQFVIRERAEEVSAAVVENATPTEDTSDNEDNK